MLILIEGCDGVGKTTLAQRLANRLLGGEVRHCAQLKRHPLEEYELDLDDYSPDTGHIIYDRHYLGELVYGPLYRKSSAIDPAMRAHIELYLNARGAVLVLLDHSHDILLERHRARGEDYLKPEHIEQVITAFRHQYARSLLLHKVRLIDPGDDEIDNLITYAHDAASDARPLQSFPTYVGRSDPKLLLLGERRGGNGRGHKAAFVPYRDTSGYFLMQALHHSMVMQPYGLANACEENVARLCDVLNDPRVVTLGNKAHAVVRTLGIPHGRAPHPQFVRRFFHSYRPDYGRIIADVAASGMDKHRWPE